MVPTINEEFTLCIWNSMLIKLRLECIGNVCCVLVYSQSVYSTQLYVHTEQWIHNFGLTKKKSAGGLIFGSHGRPRYTRIRVITRRVITRADCNTNSVCVCVCVCLSSIGGQTAGPIMTKFGTYMRIDLGMVSTKKKRSHVWSGRVGSLGPFLEAGT